MNKLLERIHADIATAWVRLVQTLNCIALALAGGAVAINAMYPKAVEEASAALPPIAKLAVMAAWAAIVHYGLRQAGKAARNG